MLEISHTAKSLIGVNFQGAPILNVYKDGDKRFILTKNGKVALSKSALYTFLQEAKAPEQKAAMARTIRKNSDGTVSMTLGGTKRGVRKKYISISAAKRALIRRYGGK